MLHARKIGLLQRRLTRGAPMSTTMEGTQSQWIHHSVGVPCA